MPIRWWRSPVLVYPRLLAFVWTALELWRLPEAWAQNPPPRPVKRTATRGDEFTKPLKDLHRLTKAAVAAQAPDGDLAAAMAAVKQARQALRDADRKVRDQFAATEQHLRQAKLPAEILQRHIEAVRSYDAKHKELDTELTEAENAHERITDHWNFQDRAPEHARLRHHLSKASDLLDKHTPKPKHQPLDPHKLPSRPAEPRWKAPQTSSRIVPTYARPGSPWLAAQEELDPAYITRVAASSDALVAQVLPKTSGLPTTTTAADLAPTEDVQITQEIRDLATELNNDPVKIYEYVRNTIDFEPTWGSIKGSVLTLWEKSGNAFDTASLLIALFRAANIPARYVLGTIQVPAAQAQNWVGGVTTPHIAATVLASGGVPTSYNATSVTLEHVWVEVHVPFAHYRGVPLGQAGKTWIPLDASFKQYTYTQGLDVQTIVGFDVNAFLQQAQVGATIDPVTGSATNLNRPFIEGETTRLIQLLHTHIETTLPNASVLDITGGRSIAKTKLGLLPASLPYRSIATTHDAVALPNTLRHHVTIALLDEFGLNEVATVTRSLPQVATQKITISYGPASDADRATLESLASQQATSIPAYLLRLIPEIRLDEAIVATGPGIGTGKDQTILVTLEGPNLSSEQMRHDRIAGDYALIGLELGNSSGRRLSESRARLSQTKDKLERQDLAGLAKGDIVGELLNAAALAYWAELNVFARVASSVHRVVPVRLPSEALNASTVKVTYAFAVPIAGERGGLILDIKRAILTPFSLSGERATEIAVSMVLGITSSHLEAGIYEQMFRASGQGVSAAHVLRHANAQGVPVYQISQMNAETILPVLAIDADTKNDIRNAVSAGKIVYAVGSEITINAWTGTGYFVIDPVTGAGAFQISGGLAGGFWIAVSEVLLWASLFLAGLGISLRFCLSLVGLLKSALTSAVIALIAPILDALRLSTLPQPAWPSAKTIILTLANMMTQLILGVGVYLLLFTAPITWPAAIAALLLIALMAGFDYLINYIISYTRLPITLRRWTYARAHSMLPLT